MQRPLRFADLIPMMKCDAGVGSGWVGLRKDLVFLACDSPVIAKAACCISIVLDKAVQLMKLSHCLPFRIGAAVSTILNQLMTRHWC